MAVHGNSRRFSRIININEFFLAVSLSIIHSQVLAVSMYEEFLIILKEKRNREKKKKNPRDKVEKRKIICIIKKGIPW